MRKMSHELMNELMWESQKSFLVYLEKIYYLLQSERTEARLMITRDTELREIQTLIQVLSLARQNLLP